MLRNLFRPDSGLMIVMSQITDCIFLSLFWVLCCFGVVTAGASFAALYDATYQAFRKGEKHSWGCFFGAFRRNLKASLIPNVVFLTVTVLIVWGTIRLWNGAVGGTVSWTAFAAGVLVGIVIVGVVSLLWPMLSRFENSTAALLRNTLVLGFGNLPRTLALGMLNVGTGLLCLIYVFPLFFLPALAALVGTLLIEPIFKPYMPEEPAEEEVPEE